MPEPAAREEATYSLGAVSRLTGLSGHVLRAWERRYSAIEPLRTAGGTRRYRESDVARLQLLRAAVDAGHPIGTVARLSEAELKRRAGPRNDAAPLPLRALFDATSQLDAEELQRLLGLQLSALGARRFATQVAAPLLREVGTAWAAGRLDIAAEHLVSAQIRSLLGAVLRQRIAPSGAVTVVFATPAGERHELGTLIAAVCASEAGARVVYLGPDLPTDDIVRAARQSDAHAVALGLVERSVGEVGAELRELRRSLPRDCSLWIGGTGPAGDEVGSGELPDGVEAVADIETLETRLGLLAV